MDEDAAGATQLFSSSRRKDLFLELAAGPEGVAPMEVYRRAAELGDTVTEEAYYNIARRLVHRGLLTTIQSDSGTRFRLAEAAEERWLEQEELRGLIRPDYPLAALT